MLDSFSEHLTQKMFTHRSLIAVNTGCCTVSYEELLNEALGFASFGLPHTQLVGICLDRTDRELPIALLACIIAGVGYVPLDPNYPAERLQYMIQNSGISYLICNERQASHFTDQCVGQYVDGQLKILNIQDILATQSREYENSGCELEQRLRSYYEDQKKKHQDLDKAVAYVIYTSGSTGVPKGVTLSQGALGHLIQWQANQPEFLQPSRVLQFTPLSFDVHFQEFFTTFFNGGSLYLVDEVRRRDPVELLKKFVKTRFKLYTFPLLHYNSLPKSLLPNLCFLKA